MSYNGSGTYVPPAGQPVATGTVIQSATFNTLVTDIGNTFNNVLPRDGQAPMQGQLKLIDGTSAIPGIAFNSEASTGIYHPAPGALALVASGVENLRINSAGRVIIGGASDDGDNTLQVNGPAKVSGAATLASTLNVTGAATLASTLSVIGAASLASTLAVTGSTTISGALGVTGGTTLSGGVNNVLNVTVPDSGARTTLAKFTQAGQRSLSIIGEYGGYDVGTSNGILLDSAGGSFGIGASGSTPNLLVDTKGNVLVGKTGLLYALDDSRRNFEINGNTSVMIAQTIGGGPAGYLYSDLNGTELYGDKRLTLTVAGAERLRIDNNGNLGIGVSSLSARLHVGPTGNLGATPASTVFADGYSTSPQLRYIFNHAGSNLLGIGSDGVSSMIFGRTSSASTGTPLTTEYARFDSSGNLGVGVTNPGVYGKFVASFSAPLSAIAVLGKGSSDICADVLIHRSGSASGAGQGPSIQLEDGTSTNTRMIQASGGALQFMGYGSSAWAEHARIDSSGNLSVLSGAVSTGLGSGGLALSGNTTPDVGYLGYNYTNVSGTESVANSARASWRIGFGNGVTTGTSFQRRAANAAANQWTDLVRIGDSGNVGIGTTTPDQKLTIASGSDATGASDGISFYGSASNKQAAILSFNGGTYNGDLRFYTKQSGAPTTAVVEAARFDPIGRLLVGSNPSVAPTSKLDVYGNTPELSLSTGTAAVGSDIASIKLYSDSSYVNGTRWAGMKAVVPSGAAGIDFTALAFYTNNGGTNNAERLRIDSSGKLLVGLTADNGSGSRLQVSGGASVSGNVNISNGILYATGQSMLGGATSDYNSYSSGLTLNYAGIGSMYGVALKPATSTADTNAITFLASSSTYASASAVGAIKHLANDAGMNLSGAWQVNGNPIAGTNSPTLIKPTIKGYIEQFQAINPGVSVTLNPDNGTLIEMQVTANATITLPAAVAGVCYTLIVYYQGAYSLTFTGGTSLHWAGGSAPTTTSTNGKFDKYVFTCGSTYTLAQDGGRNF